MPPTTRGLGEPLQLDDDQLKALGSQLWDLMVEMEREHKEYFEDIGVWWDWHAGVPEESYKTEPFDGASNLVVPLIKMQSDASVARFMLQLFSTSRMWMGSTQNEFWSQEGLLDSTFELMNWGAREGAGKGLFDQMEPGVVEQDVIGEAIWEQDWGVRTRPIVPPNSRDGKPVVVSFGEGPVTRHRPRERTLCNRGVAIDESEAIFFQDFYTWGQLSRVFHQDEFLATQHNRPPTFIKKQFEDLHRYMGIEGPAAEVENERRARMGLQPWNESQTFAPHDVRTVWLDFPMLSMFDRQKLGGVGPANGLSTVRGINRLGKTEIDELRVPIKVYFHPKSRRVLGAIYSPYLLDSPPVYQAMRRRGGKIDEPRGSAKDLEHFQRGVSSGVNQVFDAITMGNSVKIITNDKNLEDLRIVPNKIIYSADPDTQIKELKVSKEIFPDLAVVNLLMAMGERVGGVSDGQLGKETRMGGHPQPATNFLGLLEQSQMNSTRSLTSLERAVSRMGSHRAVMYQQFQRSDAPWITEVFGGEDAERIKVFLEADKPILGTVQFAVHGLSRLHNPDAERQKAVVIDQMVTNHYVIVAKYVEAIERGAGQRTAQLLEKAIEAKTKSLINFLEASEIDEVTEYVERLQQSQGANVDFLNQLTSGIAGNGGAPGEPAGGAGQGVLPGAGVESLPPQAGADAGGAPAQGGGNVF